MDISKRTSQTTSHYAKHTQKERKKASWVFQDEVLRRVVIISSHKPLGRAGFWIQLSVHNEYPVILYAHPRQSLLWQEASGDFSPATGCSFDSLTAATPGEEPWRLRQSGRACWHPIPSSMDHAKHIAPCHPSDVARGWSQSRRVVSACGADVNTRRCHGDRSVQHVLINMSTCDTHDNKS